MVLSVAKMGDLAAAASLASLCTWDSPAGMASQLSRYHRSWAPRVGAPVSSRLASFIWTGSPCLAQFLLALDIRWLTKAQTGGPASE